MKYKYLKDLNKSIQSRNEDLVKQLEEKQKRIDEITVLNLKLLSEIEILKPKENK